MIDFQRTDPADRARYEALLSAAPERGCEYSFANLYLWGRQQIAFTQGCVAFFSHFYGRSVYPFPIGTGDKAAVVREILADARERGLPVRITGITEEDKAFLEGAFPEQFHFRPERDNYDYVYAIEDLAELKGRKYQKKRNHFNRFRALHPDYRVESLGSALLPDAIAMVDQWYTRRQETDPEGNYLLERRAMGRLFARWETLQPEGIAIYDGGELIALGIGTRLNKDTFDIHFEKAREDVDGAYPAVNCEFARYLREKYPEVRYLNREDDMGLEGLRKAKLSYYPHHMVTKYCAYWKEELYAP